MITIIFEGADNLGKSTIINKIVNSFKETNDITLIHCTGPHPAEGEDPFEYQKNSFREKVIKINTIGGTEQVLKTSSKNIVILDRAWYGEYVYGQIYRNAEPEKIIDMIKLCNQMLYSPCVVIHLTASPEFVLAHDDNKSISSTLDNRLEKISTEISLFKECFEKINYENFIEVNVEGEDMNYRNIEDIYNEIFNKIKKFI